MKVVTFGEVMLRLATPQNLRFSQANTFEATFGGGEANVAVSLANYGIPVEFVSRIPKNDVGESCIMNLKKYGVGTNHIVRDGERLGIYFLEKGSVSRASKVIYDRAFSSISQVQKGMFDWDIIFKDANWFHWTGITPAISQGAADVCFEAIQKANEKGIIVSCDLNFRKNLWKYGKKAIEVMPELVNGCEIILGNEEDAEMSLGIKPEGVNVKSGHIEAEAYLSVSKKMRAISESKESNYNVENFISADHNNGQVYYLMGKILHCSVYDITHIVDRVGGGMLYGWVIYGLLSFKDDDQKFELCCCSFLS
jgi:2-dehydro-3-deoxygluconokinase